MLNPKPQILVKQENHYVSVESVRFRTSISCQKSLTIPKQLYKKIEEENDNTMTNRKGQKRNNDPENIIQNTEDWVT